MSFSRLATLLCQHLDMTRHHGEQEAIYSLDTFDWRLYNKGLAFEVVCHAGMVRQRLRKLHSTQVICQFESKDIVHFYWDLTPGFLRDTLTQILGVRALVPKLHLTVKRLPLVKTNSDMKTVLRILLHEYQRQNHESNRLLRLQKRIELRLIKGYEEPFHQAARYLEQELHFEKTGDDILVTGLNATGVQPTRYSVKVKFELLADTPAITGMKACLLQMLKIMRVNEAGIKDDIDSEFLHDYRVAVRMTRSALQQIKGVFPLRSVISWQKHFHWIASQTSLQRDLDVYLLNFADYRNMLPDDLYEDLEPLHRLLEKKKKSAHQAVVHMLQGKRYQNFMSDFQKFLSEPDSISNVLINAQKPIKKVADQRIWKIYKRALKQGNSINNESPADQLHELRKTCKKLRYLMELFGSLYDSETHSTLVDVLKNLQDNLGNYNDLHIHAEKLKEFSVELQGLQLIHDGTSKAIAFLVKHFEDNQIEERRRFDKSFSKLSEKKIKGLFQQLFKPTQASGQAIEIVS